MEADKLIMRKIKMEVNTLDKYVNRKKNTKKGNILIYYSNNNFTFKTL